MEPNKHGRKLDYTKVQMIRLRAQQGVTHGTLAREFRVTITQIGRIIRHEVWQEIPELLLPQADLEAQIRRMLKLQEQIKDLDAVTDNAAEAPAPALPSLPKVDLQAIKLPPAYSWINEDQGDEE